MIKSKIGNQGEASSSGGASQQTSSLMSATTTLNDKYIAKIAHWHRLNPCNIKVPTPMDRVHTPSTTHISLIFLHCDARGIPLMSDYYPRFVFHIDVVPHQMAPNTYRILLGLRRLFEFVFGKKPKVDEILYLYRFKPTRTNPSFYFLEANKHITLLFNLRSNPGDYQWKYFFVRDDSYVNRKFCIVSKTSEFHYKTWASSSYVCC